MVRRSPLLHVVLLFTLAAMLRVGWVVVRYRGEDRAATLAYPDEEAYWLSAGSLAHGQGLIDEFGYRATYMPGYPAFLALFAGAAKPLLLARLVQALLAAAVAPMTYLLARAWIELHGTSPSQPHPQTQEFHRRDAGATSDSGHTIGLLAGLAAACDPFLIFFSGLLLTEALFAVMLTAAWCTVLLLLKGCVESNRAPSAKRGEELLSPGGDPSLRAPDSEVGNHRWIWSVLTGILVLGCIMLRPSAWLLVPAIVAVLLLWCRPGVPSETLELHRRDAGATWVSGRTANRRAWAMSTILVGVVIIGLTPWAARNASVIGEWRWLTTRGGISLYDGLQNRPAGAGELAGGSDLAHTKAWPKVQGLSETQWDRFFRERAIECMRQDPWRIMRLAGAKFLRTWNIVPNEAAHRRGRAAMVSAAWMIFVLLTAAAGWWRVRRCVRCWLVLLLPVAGFTLLHMVFVGSVRYRVPLMPLVFVLSATGLHGLITGLLQGRVVRPAPTAETTCKDDHP